MSTVIQITLVSRTCQQVSQSISITPNYEIHGESIQSSSLVSLVNKNNCSQSRQITNSTATRCFSQPHRLQLQLLWPFVNSYRMVAVVTKAHILSIQFHPSMKVAWHIRLTTVKLCSPSLIHCSHVLHLKAPIQRCQLAGVYWLSLQGWWLYCWTLVWCALRVLRKPRAPS